MITQQKTILAAGFAILLFLLLPSRSLGQSCVRHRLNPSKTLRPILPPQAILHSRQPDHAVVIPFRTRYERTYVTTVHHRRVVRHAIFTAKIFVTVKVGTKVVPAMVDTGFSDTVWPADLKLGPISRQNLLYIIDDGGNMVTSGLSVLNHIHIGGLELKNLPTYGLNESREETEQNPDEENVLVLGDTAFAGLVLTIDYLRKVLIVHPAGFQPPNGAFLYPCGWSDKDDTTGVGVPAIWGSVEGEKALGIFDTGWDSDLLGLSPQMYQKILPQLRLHKVHRTSSSIYAAFGQSSSTYIERLHWDLPGLTSTGGALAVARLSPHVDMVLGFGLLPNMRVTIDYFAQL